MLEHVNSQPADPERIVILGAKGFVGSAVHELLTGQNIPVLPLGRQDIDLMDGDAADDLAARLLPTDSLLVISAQAPVKDNAMLQNNIRMMSAVCEAVERVKPDYVLYVSSDAVYADSDHPMDEGFCAEPESLHGIMHLARETMLKTAYEGPLGIIRPTLIYGKDDPHNGYGPNQFRRLAQDGQDIVLFGEGEERRDHVLIDDVADLIVRMLRAKSRGALNAATGSVTSFKDVAGMVVAQVAAPVGIKTTARSGPMPHNGYRAFDPSETYAAFKDFEYTPLEKGIAKTHKQSNQKKSEGK